MQTRFYNSTHLEGDALKLAISQAKTQDEKVLQIFKDRKGHLLNPHHVHMVYQNMVNSDTPLTSIRRAINTLTLGGFLLKSESATSRGK